MKYLCLGAVLAVNLIALPVLVVAGPPGPVGGPVFVLASDASAVVSRSGGAEIGWTNFKYGRLSYSSETEYFDKLTKAGAWFVFDGRLVARLCGV